MRCANWLSFRRILVPVLVLVPTAVPGCSGQEEPSLIEGRTFQITEVECIDDNGSCDPGCENTCDEKVCEEAQPPSLGGCWITGGGFVLDDGSEDNFGGNGMPLKDGTIRGEWEHVDHATGNKFHGQVRYLVCRHVDEPGPGVPNGKNHDFDINEAYYGGPGRWFTPEAGWQDGYWFDIVANDHGEPGNQPGPGVNGEGPDEYKIVIRKLNSTETPDTIYSVGGDFAGGNFQIHPPNNGHPFTEGTLPKWVSFEP